MTSRPSPPPEATLIRLAREAANIKAPAAAKVAGISPARWSQVETGYETRLGNARPVRAPDGTLAHMAFAVGLAPHRLDQVGREGAADVLREILRQHAERIGVDGAPGAPVIAVNLDGLRPDQIQLVEGIVAELRASAASEEGHREANGA
jgi:hypothetical protein